MEVLLTNDDGCESHGLRALGAALVRAGHDVLVVAPDGNRSASSHSITLFAPLVIGQRVVDGIPRRAYAISGTPTDCGKLGLSEILGGRRPDVVVSGINLGANLGCNVFYSGTIGGAFEGVLAGVPAIAVSLDEHFTEADLLAEPSENARLTLLEGAALLSVGLIERLVTTATADRDFSGARLLLYNINFPALPIGELKGVKVVPQGRAAFVDAYEARVDPRHRKYFWLSGVQDYVYPPGCDPDADDDLKAVRDGFVAVTPLVFDLNSRQEQQRLEAAELEQALYRVSRSAGLPTVRDP